MRSGLDPSNVDRGETVQRQLSSTVTAANILAVMDMESSFEQMARLMSESELLRGHVEDR
jgi:hypothetical protein